MSNKKARVAVSGCDSDGVKLSIEIFKREGDSHRMNVVDQSDDVDFYFDSTTGCHIRDAFIDLFPIHPGFLVPAPPPPPPPPPSTKGPQQYLGNGQHDWQIVGAQVRGVKSLRRLRVPGGWLYKDREGMTFVPLPNVVGY